MTIDQEIHDSFTQNKREWEINDLLKHDELKDWKNCDDAWYWRRTFIDIQTRIEYSITIPTYQNTIHLIILDQFRELIFIFVKKYTTKEKANNILNKFCKYSKFDLNYLKYILCYQTLNRFKKWHIKTFNINPTKIPNINYKTKLVNSGRYASVKYECTIKLSCKYNSKTTYYFDSYEEYDDDYAIE